MPVTPLHYPSAFIIHKTDRRFSLPALVVGSFIPDIEVPVMWVFFSNLRDHFILHSLVGGLTIGTLLAIVLTRFLYTPIISNIFKVDRNALNDYCRISRWMVFSCVIGILSHLILDYPMHWYNPILWPWINPDAVVGPLVLLFMQWYALETAFLIARLLMHIIMIVIWIVILAHLQSKGNLWCRHWIGEPNDQNINERV